MEKQPLTLRERQLEYLHILKELDRYCSANSLRYYLGCGTLIGAVRHHGFIPWDDDLDVFMPRPDFMQLLKDYHSNKFTLHSVYNDNSHPYNFGRLCSNEIFTPIGDKKDFVFGIDVYVINGAPTSKKEQLEHMDRTHRFISMKNKLLYVRNKLAAHNLWPYKNLEFPLMHRMLMKAEKEFAKYDFCSSDYIWPYGGGRLIMKKENYGRPIRIQFEDGLFCAPEHVHEVLTLGYGDYMKLPPEEKRHPYHTEIFFRLTD